MRIGRRIRGTAATMVVLAACTAAAIPVGAAVDPIVELERTLLKRYPAVTGPLLASSPFKRRGLRVLYAWGAASVWFQTRPDRTPACAAARVNATPLRDAILGQIMPAASDVRLWASRGISPDRGTDAFRAGILRACKLRGG